MSTCALCAGAHLRGGACLKNSCVTVQVMRILDSQFACATCLGEYFPQKGDYPWGLTQNQPHLGKQTQLTYSPLLKLGLTTLAVELGNFTWNPPSLKYLILASNDLYPQAFLLHPVSTTIYSIGPNFFQVILQYLFYFVPYHITPFTG